MKKIILVLLISIWSISSYSQTSINSSGGNVSNQNGSFSFSVGQLVYTTNKNENGSVTQGIQQPFEHQILSDNEFFKKDFKILTYPNPTSDNLIVSILNDFTNNKIEYSLFDIQGKQLMKGKIESDLTVIKIKNLSKGIYFLKVSEQNLSIKTVKIIKE